MSVGCDSTSNLGTSQGPIENFPAGIETLGGNETPAPVAAPIPALEAPPAHNPLLPDPEQTRRFASHLFPDGTDTVLEVRIMGADWKSGFLYKPKQYEKTYAGWYNNLSDFCIDASRLRGVSGYAIPNPTIRDKFAVSANELNRTKSGMATTDEQIACLRWASLDFDAEKAVKEASATDEEWAGALAKRDSFLDENPDMAASAIWGNSGNGGWVLVRLADLPNDEIHRAAVACLVNWAADNYGADRKTKNPARLMPLIGTVKCKGSNIPERPWRLATIDSPPERDLTPLTPFDLPDWVARQEAMAAASDASPVPPDTAQRGAVERSGPASRTRTDSTVVPRRSRSLANRIRRARAYIWKIGPAISGNGGHDCTFDVARSLVYGFDLTRAEAWPLIKEWNATCDPPWKDHELEHKLDDADAKGNDPDPSKPRGHLFDAPREGSLDAEQSQEFDGTILISTKEYAVNSLAIEALSEDPDVYHRGHSLVLLRRDCSPNRNIKRPEGSARIAPLLPPTLREKLSLHADWKRVDSDGRIGPAHPPDWVVKAVAARGEWPGIRPLEGITNSPALRPDGTILDQPGYDEATGLIYEPTGDVPVIPTNPSHDDAREAAQQLLKLVADFPFAFDAEQGQTRTQSPAAVTWLAALLTPLARPAIDGPCPLFHFDANAPGSGKTLLVDLVSHINTGRTMSRTAYADNEEEMRKRITSIALGGDRMMLLDNIATALGGAALDAALTATSWRDRILGRSEMTAELPLHTIWYSSGNNVPLKGDIVRRVLQIRLETLEEHPEERTDFEHRNIVEYVHRERGRLLAAGLTILRAYFVAGCPGKNTLTPMGSYEAWSDVVRSAVYWATGIDPYATRSELQANDPQTLARRALIEGWSELLASDNGLTVAAALDQINEYPDRFKTLRTVMLEWSKDGRLPSARRVGQHLANIKGRVVDGKAIRSVSAGKNTLAWKVVSVGSDK